MRRWTFVGLSILAAALPAPAQVFTPTFQSPFKRSDLGVYLSSGPGDFAVEGVLRRNFGGYGLGARVGLADVGNAALIAGIEFTTPLTTVAPLEVNALAGAQAVLGDHTGVGAHGGAGLGARLPFSNFALVPYGNVRIGLVDPIGPGDADLDLLADLGVDVEFTRGFVLRIGFGLGDPTAAWGVGFAVRR